jgi:hypothetical protein
MILESTCDNSVVVGKETCIICIPFRYVGLVSNSHSRLVQGGYYRVAENEGFLTLFLEKILIIKLTFADVVLLHIVWVY